MDTLNLDLGSSNSNEFDLELDSTAPFSVVIYAILVSFDDSEI